MKPNSFEDCGIFYRNSEMIKKDIVLSAGSHILYDISDYKDVKIIKIADNSLFNAVWENILSNHSKTRKNYVLEHASVCREAGEFDKLIWRG